MTAQAAAAPVLFAQSSGEPAYELRGEQVQGSFFAEVVLPDGDLALPAVAGWSWRVWPTARLGDGTLEARPLLPHLSAEHLRDDLGRVGVQVLGPVRQRSSFKADRS